ncbi:MAG TPA: NAD(P)-dependent oxidoreductase [Chthonomonadaceae bacterium]|nr:NAD(P)-dependent oxidoreductase [Chthonomonadaceae bacterium]
MHVLVVGGSGYVGKLVLPEIARHHDLHIFDLRPPPESIPVSGHTIGDVGDAEALHRAAQGKDILLYMAMGTFAYESTVGILSGFDVNVKGVYLALHAAHEAGIEHAVYTSSMSVYDGPLEARYFHDEEMPPDSIHIYGFTKRLGEEACRTAARRWGMSINALRLCLPTPRDQWLERTREGVPTIATTDDDVARAILAALDYRGPGFQAFMISGDYEQKIMNMSKARRILGWEPLARPKS